MQCHALPWLSEASQAERARARVSRKVVQPNPLRRALTPNAMSPVEAKLSTTHSSPDPGLCIRNRNWSRALHQEQKSVKNENRGLWRDTWWPHTAMAQWAMTQHIRPNPLKMQKRRAFPKTNVGQGQRHEDQHRHNIGATQGPMHKALGVQWSDGPGRHFPVVYCVQLGNAQWRGGDTCAFMGGGGGGSCSGVAGEG